MVSIEPISGRDCMNPVRLSNKINEIINVLEENDVLTKSEYQDILKKGETKCKKKK